MMTAMRDFTKARFSVKEQTEAQEALEHCAIHLEELAGYPRITKEALLLLAKSFRQLKPMYKSR